MADSEQKLNQAVMAMVDNLDRTYLRKMQKNMYNCIAKCYDNTSGNKEVIENCAQNCSIGLNEIQSLFQQEMQYYQQRIGRCGEGCQDTIRDMASGIPNLNENVSKQAELTNLHEKCVAKCVNDNLGGIKKIEQRVVTEIKKRM